MRFVLGVLLVLGILPASASAQSAPQPPLDPLDLRSFHELVEACRPLGQPFQSFAAEVPAENWPLPVRLVRNDSRVLFGSPYDPRTEAPLLSLDLTDLELLPQAAAVRSWAPDSSWAYTLCEMLGHELAEGLEYARLADSIPVTPQPQDGRFPMLRRLAHQVGLERERELAVHQSTRLDSQRQPYGRTRHCFVGSETSRPAVALVLGLNTVLWELQDGGNLRRIRYLVGLDACGVL